MTDDESTRAELERLRALVGPDEASYDQLRHDRDAAVAAARDAERELGRERGRNEEYRVQLARARQDQADWQAWLDRRRRVRAEWRRVRAGVRRRLPGGG